MGKKILDHGTQVRTKVRNVVVVTRATSRDILMGHINLLRQFMHLPPLNETVKLDMLAERKAARIVQQQKLLHTESWLDTHPTLSKMFALGKTAFSEHIQSPYFQIFPHQEHVAYPKEVLSAQCAHVGISVYEDPQNSQNSFAVYVFAIERTP